MSKPAYLEIQQKQTKQKLTRFLSDVVVPEGFGYQDLREIESFIDSELAICNYADDIEALCAYFELGDWFTETMQECEFNVAEFIDELRAELKRRAKE